MAKALVITTEGEVLATEIPSENGHHLIHEIVGGWFDAVRSEQLVGYVHDEGILIGLAPNALASVLFERPLAGNCVVVGALNERGEYDGENHDVPRHYKSELLQVIAQGLTRDAELMEALTAGIAQLADTPPVVQSLTDEEFTAWLNGEGE